MPRPTRQSDLAPRVPSLNVTTQGEQARSLAAFLRAKVRYRATSVRRSGSTHFTRNASTIELSSACALRVASLLDVSADHEEAA